MTNTLEAMVVPPQARPLEPDMQAGDEQRGGVSASMDGAWVNPRRGITTNLGKNQSCKHKLQQRTVLSRQGRVGQRGQRVHLTIPEWA